MFTLIERMKILFSGVFFGKSFYFCITLTDPPILLNVINAFSNFITCISSFLIFILLPHLKIIDQTFSFINYFEIYSYYMISLFITCVTFHIFKHYPQKNNLLFIL